MNKKRAEYGQGLIKELSKELTKEFGKGFSKSNLFNMRNFFLAHPKFQTVSRKLSWSHYCELLSISDMSKRTFYETENVNSNLVNYYLKKVLQIEQAPGSRVIIMTTADSNDEHWLSSPLLGKQNRDWCAF